MDTFLRDWKDNCITERSFQCLDNSFFEDVNKPFQLVEGADGEQNIVSNNIRHGIYAKSSKDWESVKLQIAEESKRVRDNHIQSLIENGQMEKEKSSQEIAQQNKDIEAQ